MNPRNGGLPATHPAILKLLAQRGITHQTHEIAYVGRGPYMLVHETLQIEDQTVHLSVHSQGIRKPLLAYGLPDWDPRVGPWWVDPKWKSLPAQATATEKTPDPIASSEKASKTPLPPLLLF